MSCCLPSSVSDLSLRIYINSNGLDGLKATLFSVTFSHIEWNSTRNTNSSTHSSRLSINSCNSWLRFLDASKYSMPWLRRCSTKLASLAAPFDTFSFDIKISTKSAHIITKNTKTLDHGLRPDSCRSADMFLFNFCALATQLIQLAAPCDHYNYASIRSAGYRWPAAFVLLNYLLRSKPNQFSRYVGISSKQNLFTIFFHLIIRITHYNRVKQTSQ